MAKYDVIIAGSGLGGLECGYILSRKGYHVCVLEQNACIGGCLQTFRRGKSMFDTGFHYVGGLEAGQSLHSLFRYFDLLDLPWQKMDENGFSEVIIQGKSYLFPSGHERFADKMSEYFPHQQKQITAYTSFLKKVGENIMNSFVPAGVKNDFTASTLLERSAYGFLQDSFDDPLLINVLSGASFTMELCAEKLPLYVFAQINNSFIQSAWRLKGGGSLIAEKLAGSIRSMGGEVRTNAKVTRFNEHDGLITSVCVNNEEEIEGKQFISSMHPALTLTLIPDTPSIRKIYRKRMNNMANTHGIFTAHLQLKPDSVPYLNRNINIFNGISPWRDVDERSSGTKAALVSFQTPENGAYTSNIDILTPMLWQEVSPWANGRGVEYSAFKAQKAEECVDLLSKRLPQLKENIERIYTSTPLTYRDYTGTYEGSAYGIRKDYSHLFYTLLSPQTQIPNLLLTGQNLNLHGVLGVSMTSFFTCAKLVGMESLLKDLENG
ncbi:all-trans-retinol 13,14-reductase [Bacteroidia bacterium]|nr:all-trans-retinol 13,14-reductase [Bacteroidia bacterium]